MDQKRKKLHDVIEKAAENRDEGSKWDLRFPIDIASPKKEFYPKTRSSSD
jgi:hypothetical protein